MVEPSTTNFLKLTRFEEAPSQIEQLASLNTELLAKVLDVES